MRAKRERAGEWVGGRFELPEAPPDEESEDGERPPHVVIWKELDGDRIVALVAVDSGEPPEAALVILEAAMREPAVGEPRRPTSVRVAEPELAAFLRRELPADIEVKCAPTPELEPVLRELADSLLEDADD